MKRVAIIGGGISGLAVLHYLKQRFSDMVEVTLYERNHDVGGSIRSIKKEGALFEWGPNSFLDNQPASLQLIDELGISPQLLEASLSSRRRYIQMQGQLHHLPMSPGILLPGILLSYKDKWSLISGLFHKGISTDCSIYDYVSQRFSSRIAGPCVRPFFLQEQLQFSVILFFRASLEHAHHLPDVNLAPPSHLSKQNLCYIHTIDHLAFPKNLLQILRYHQKKLHLPSGLHSLAKGAIYYLFATKSTLQL
ncbi:MAG: FAD-dependent oxidoreductase [Candidatus Omnitrophica bacterium]|nr:FAD-dependent oxidoreductase [Candidatus Omnitrophota bacterium]